MKRILITGMSGLIGGILRSHLEAVGGYELTALNRRQVDGVRTVQADIGDLESIRPAFEGQDVVVHLAAHVASEPMEDVVRGNLAGTWNVYEAAREAGVKRVIFASSGRYDTRDRPRPAVQPDRGGRLRGSLALGVAESYEGACETQDVLRRVEGVGRGAGPRLLRRLRSFGAVRSHRFVPS